MSKENIVHTNIKGAEVVIYPMRDVRSVHVDIRMHAGSWFEGEKWGAFHFLEHALHLGTKSFPSKVDLEIFKEEYAISSNASCGPGSMSVWAHFPDQSIDAGLKLLCEILFESTLPEDELKRELDVISQEFKDKWSSPGNRFGRACDEQLFGKGHEYTRDGMGNPEDLKNITRENLLDLAQEHIYPANMVISVVGNVDPNQIILKLEQLLPESKDRKSKEKENFQAIRSGNKYLFHKEDVKTVNIDITWCRGQGYARPARCSRTPIPHRSQEDPTRARDPGRAVRRPHDLPPDG